MKNSFKKNSARTYLVHHLNIILNSLLINFLFVTTFDLTKNRFLLNCQNTKLYLLCICKQTVNFELNLFQINQICFRKFIFPRLG
jgi:hypothetical protein